jgi:LacI family transcriptional regulator
MVRKSAAKEITMGVTIRKIAEDLNLAVSTVSKALRDSHEISADTKARVFEYATKINYSPNPYASSLKGRRSRNIAVVVPEVSDTFFSEAINGIEEVAQREGYHVMIYLTHEDGDQEQSIVNDLGNGRVDGILISVAAGATDRDHLQNVKLPLVFFDRVREDIPSTRIVTNDYESGYNAVKHLISRGCRRIAFLSTFGGLNIIRYRQEGYLQALKDHGIDVKKCPIVSCTNNESENVRILKQLLDHSELPDSIIGSVEKVTMQAYSVCHELNLSIPVDVKVVGFSHLQIASLLNPSLTTITQPAYEMGRAAATALFKTLSKKKLDVVNEQIEIPSVLIERASTR